MNKPDTAGELMEDILKPGKLIPLDIYTIIIGPLEALVDAEVAKAYRKGYNDNSRDCMCDSVDYTGFPEKVPHRHLMDDGKSHNIKPILTADTRPRPTRRKPNESNKEGVEDGL